MQTNIQREQAALRWVEGERSAPNKARSPAISKARAFTIYTQTMAVAWFAAGLIHDAFVIGVTFAQNMVIIATGFTQ